jgi:signal peptidase I
MTEYVDGTVATNERKPSAAAMLSLLYIGLGHIYCGRLAMGLSLNLLSLLPVLFAIMLSLLPNPAIGLVGLGIACVFAPAVYLFSVIDSYRLAKKIGANYVPKDFNCGTVYTLLTIGGIASGITIAPLVAVNARANVAEAIYCAGESMSPTLLRGDLFLINKRTQRQLPHRGDIVVFLCPGKRDIKYVKRVVGLPGDTVEVLPTGEVILNGGKLTCEPTADSALALDSSDTGKVMSETCGEATYPIELAPQKNGDADTKPAEAAAMKVPQDHCFVLGDNRRIAEDSRRFGCVPLGDILGNAEFVYFPAKSWSRFGAIQH